MTWLKEKYQNPDQIDPKDSATTEEKKYLKGLHQANTSSAAHDPSHTDIECLIKAYGK